MKKNLKIVFMGTSGFAAQVLQVLAARMKQNSSEEDTMIVGAGRISINGVYSKPPSRQGKGLHFQNSPVHELADELRLDIFTPETFKNQENINMLKSLQPDVIVVAAYGLILRQEVLDIPIYGCINVHPSSLPRWRGAAPIQRMLMAGDLVTDVCIMQMDAGLDTGDVLLREKIEVDIEINSSDLAQKLGNIGGEMVLRVLDKISDILAAGLDVTKEMKGEVQSCEGVTYAQKIEKSDRPIDWKKNAWSIHCKVRGLAIKPGAYFFDNGKVVKILKTRVAENIEIKHGYKPGDFIVDKGKALYVICGDGQALELLALQREGRAACDGIAFAAGSRTIAEYS